MNLFFQWTNFFMQTNIYAEVA